MEITGVKVRRIYNNNTIKAIVSIVIDNSLAVHELKVIEGKERTFVAMPSVREADGTYRDIIHPLSSEVRENIETTVISEYRHVLSELSEKGM